MKPQETTPWIFRPRDISLPGTRDEGTKVTLVLCPPAGTGATVFNPWIDCLSKQLQSADVDWCNGFRILPVELPGRGMRMKETLLDHMDQVVDGVVNALVNTYLGGDDCSSPVVILGHSLGGWIAFETVRELERRHGHCVACLVVSAIRSPRLSGVENDIDATAMHLLGDGEFWTAMERRYGTNKELEHPSIRKFMYPVLKADFQISETFSPDPDETVSCPIFVSGGLSDVRYTREMLDAWSPCSTSGRCHVDMFDGGHHYLFSKDESCVAHVDFTMRAIRDSITSVSADTSDHQQDDVVSKKSAPDTHKSTSDIDAVSTQCQPQDTLSISSYTMTEHSSHMPVTSVTDQFGNGEGRKDRFGNETDGCSCVLM